jgi:putative Mg2+ transporter-C (MgtC) family protein
MNGHAPARLEQLVAELSVQSGIQAVQWNAGDQLQTD